MIVPTSQKNRLTFGDGPVPDMYSGSLSTFLGIAAQNILGDSYWPQNSVKSLLPTRQWIHYILGAIQRTPESESVRKTGFESGSLSRSQVEGVRCVGGGMSSQSAP